MPLACKVPLEAYYFRKKNIAELCFLEADVDRIFPAKGMAQLAGIK